MVAPAQNISSGFFNGSGVSASTPMVAGIAAGLLDQRPSLLNYPEQMKAILLAGSEAKHALTPGGNQSISAEGLGTASAKWASRVAEKDTTLHTGGYGGMRFNAVGGGDCVKAPPAQTIDFVVPYESRKVRFVIDWMARTGDANPRSGSTFTRRYGDFNLTIRKGSTSRRQLDPERVQRRVGRLHRRRPRHRRLHGRRHAGPLGLHGRDRAGGLGVGQLHDAVAPSGRRPNAAPRGRGSWVLPLAVVCLVVVGSLTSGCAPVVPTGSESPGSRRPGAS